MAKQPSPYLISRVLFQLVDLTHAQSCTQASNFNQRQCQAARTSVRQWIDAGQRKPKSTSLETSRDPLRSWRVGSP
ncbi:hypothetical protein F4813DRAFT_341498 [Daldinia decipiens]|uniref:uncharacterized protein n=1 Tax=Daldinia decipiens TaxID=326647 RepID=UPI0020C48D46|nr:uncharacterized protein F4813DRAFT_341498 [Daldinia decipiens]KAI1662669.1 hypothetical protein F4813DRAFT_341498 [Daldinia decipiens]